MFGRKWLRKQRQVARALKDSVAHRWLGEHLFSQVLWAPRRKSVAAGLALGLFIAFTPTIPFQMLLAATLACLLKVNLPAAIVAVWVTNPFTALPIYLSANRLGCALLQGTWLLSLVQDAFVPDSRYALFLNHAAYLWTGSLVMGGMAALGGWGMVHLLWRFLE